MRRKLISFAALCLSDYLTVFLSFALASLLRNHVFTLFDSSLRARPALFSIYFKTSYMFAVWFVVFLYERLYTKRYSFWDETRNLLKSTTLAFSFIMIAVFLTQEYVRFSRLIILMAWLLSLAAFPPIRLFAKTVLLRTGVWKKKVMIVGSTSSAALLVEAINQNKSMGYEIVGCLTDDAGMVGRPLGGVQVLGVVEELESWKEKTGFEDIIVALPDWPSQKIVDVLKRWEQKSETIRYIPRTGDLITSGVEIENIGKILSLTVRRNLAKPWNIGVKTVFEFILSLILSVFLVPLFLAVALIIKLDSRGPVFFVQERVGKKGRPIRLIKFRSMYHDAARRLEEHFRADPGAREEWSKFKKLKSADPRVTRFGRVLRKYSLDELPQLVNVLKGEMSLVGPRPYLREEIEDGEPGKSFLFLVKPGITGPWQVGGRNTLSFKDRLFLDEYYIRNWSLWTDIIILLKTLKIWVTGEGAF